MIRLYYDECVYHNGLFVFGSKIFHEEIKRDAISALPLELSWTIFLYLDKPSLHVATEVCKRWKYIIDSNETLHKRLDTYNNIFAFGPGGLMFYKTNVGQKKKRNYTNGKVNNYIEKSELEVQSSKRLISKKRSGDNSTNHSKRMRFL